MVTNPYQEKSECSRCKTVTETWYHVCKSCRDKAQNNYLLQVTERSIK